jgi:hypothetical protein
MEGAGHRAHADGRQGVRCLVIKQATPRLPVIAADWRDRATVQGPSNLARLEHAGEGFPAQDSPVFSSQAELTVYQTLVGIQRNPSPRTPLPCCRCPELSSATRASAPRTSSWSATAAPRSSRSTARATTPGRARPMTKTRPALGQVRRSHHPHPQRAHQRPASLKDRLREDLWSEDSGQADCAFRLAHRKREA